MPWMIVAMLPTCSLTLIAYWGWIITLARCVHYHFPFLRFYISRIILYSSKKPKKKKEIPRPYKMDISICAHNPTE